MADVIPIPGDGDKVKFSFDGSNEAIAIEKRQDAAPLAGSSKAGSELAEHVEEQGELLRGILEQAQEGLGRLDRVWAALQAMNAKLEMGDGDIRLGTL